MFLFQRCVESVQKVIVVGQSLFQTNMEQVKEEVEVKTETESIFFPAESDYKEEDQQVK